MIENGQSYSISFFLWIFYLLPFEVLQIVFNSINLIAV